MADEILVLERSNERQSVFFLFPIAAPVQVSGANVVPTPATDELGANVLPAIAEAVLTAQEKTDLDAGTLAYATTSFRPPPGATGGDILAKVQARYAVMLAEFNSDYAARYEFAGGRFNAV
jgi:hypothetical protein